MPDKCIYMGSHSLLGSKLSISCKGYNVNLQTAVAAILVFVKCPKSIASEVLVVLLKAVSKCEVNPTSGFQSKYCIHKQYPALSTMLIFKLLWQPSWFSYNAPNQ